MHGPVPALPPHRPPARATVIVLRVVFVAAAVLSLGLLAWATLLRAAIVRRGQLGWWLFGGDLVVLIGSFVLVTGYPETDWRTDVGVALVLIQIAVAVAYYLVVDIRAQRTAGYGDRHVPAAYPGIPPAAASAAHHYGPPRPPVPAPLYAQETQPYGAPGAAPVNPYAMTETRLPQPPAPGAPPHPSPPPAGPYAPPPQDRPQPQRIDRVRAELDELSDYLRKEEGR
ncbi:hypothetical protein ACTPOK_26110 [Streptomyces inhibens]|uniref:hypothetical protein n=1 Tax=Streptomyces inhibens TaxID=2293571 RepID=UPI00402A6AE3